MKDASEIELTAIKQTRKLEGNNKVIITALEYVGTTCCLLLEAFFCLLLFLHLFRKQKKGCGCFYIIYVENRKMSVVISVYLFKKQENVCGCFCIICLENRKGSVVVSVLFI